MNPFAWLCLSFFLFCPWVKSGHHMVMLGLEVQHRVQYSLDPNADHHPFAERRPLKYFFFLSLSLSFPIFLQTESTVCPFTWDWEGKSLAIIDWIYLLCFVKGKNNGDSDGHFIDSLPDTDSLVFSISIYIYIYECMYVCMCMCASSILSFGLLYFGFSWPESERWTHRWNWAEKERKK